MGQSHRQGEPIVSLCLLKDERSKKAVDLLILTMFSMLSVLPARA